MSIRFLAGVAILAGAATVLAKRYRKQAESGAAALAADAAVKPTVAERKPPAPRQPSPAPLADGGDTATVF